MADEKNMDELKVQPSFRGKELKCCEMIEYYNGRYSGQIVTQSPEIVEDLIVRKKAIPRPLGYVKPETPEAPESDGEKAEPESNELGEQPGSDADEPEDVVLEEGERSGYADLRWNDLRGVAKERGLNVQGMKRPEVEEALEALDEEE